MMSTGSGGKGRSYLTSVAVSGVLGESPTAGVASPETIRRWRRSVDGSTPVSKRALTIDVRRSIASPRGHPFLASVPPNTDTVNVVVVRAI